MTAKDDGGARSRDFSSDPMFDPDELFAVIEREDNVHRIAEAMRAFLSRGDTHLFERSVAVFVRSARARAEPVERVLGVLENLADEQEGHPQPGYAERQTPLRTLILRGVLLAFYGGEAVRREAAARGVRHESQRRRIGDEPAPDDVVG